MLLLTPTTPGLGPRPSGTFALNRDSPVAMGLAGWWPIVNDYHDYCRANHLSVTGALPRNVFPYSSGFGKGCPSAGTANRAVTTVASGLGTLSEAFTMACWAVFQATPPSGQVFTIGTGSVGHNLRYNAVGRFFWARGSDGASVVSQVTTFTDYVPRHVAITWDGKTATIYHNGMAEAGSVSPTINTGTISRVGLYVNSNSGFPEGPNAGATVCDLRFWKRCLTPREVWGLYAPQTRWDLYWQPGRTLYFDIGAASIVGDVFHSAVFGARSPLQPVVLR